MTRQRLLVNRTRQAAARAVSRGTDSLCDLRQLMRNGRSALLTSRLDEVGFVAHVHGTLINPPPRGARPMHRPPDHSDSSQADKASAALPPEDERRRIIAEEEYRKAVAAQVDRQFSPRYIRFARHLNEPIVLWVLSTVFVGLVSLAYKQWQDNRQHRTEEIEVGRKASAELYFRISGCDAIGPNSDREDVETLLSSVIGLRPLYSEYQGQRLDAVYLTACLLGRNCTVPPDSVLSSTERIRRVLKPIIARTPTGTPLPTRSFLPQVRSDCERLLPVRDSIKSLMDRPVIRASFWKRMFD